MVVWRCCRFIHFLNDIILDDDNDDNDQDNDDVRHAGDYIDEEIYAEDGDDGDQKEHRTQYRYQYEYQYQNQTRGQGGESAESTGNNKDLDSDQDQQERDSENSQKVLGSPGLFSEKNFTDSVIDTLDMSELTLDEPTVRNVLKSIRQAMYGVDFNENRLAAENDPSTTFLDIPDESEPENKFTDFLSAVQVDFSNIKPFVLGRNKNYFKSDNDE